MTSQSQELAAYTPVYNDIPENWEDARSFLVEQLRLMTNALNEKEIGFHLEENLLSGKSFIPVELNPVQYRSVFRKVIDMGGVVAGPNSKAHGITFDANFTLTQLYGTGTDSTGFTAVPFPNDTDSLTMDSTNVNINSSADYDRAYVVIEYILEV